MRNLASLCYQNTSWEKYDSNDDKNIVFIPPSVIVTTFSSEQKFSRQIQLWIHSVHPLLFDDSRSLNFSKTFRCRWKEYRYTHTFGICIVRNVQMVGVMGILYPWCLSAKNYGTDWKKFFSERSVYDVYLQMCTWQITTYDKICRCMILKWSSRTTTRSDKRCSQRIWGLLTTKYTL